MCKDSKIIPCRATEPLPGSALTTHIWDSSLKATYGTEQCLSSGQEKKAQWKRRDCSTPRGELR